MAENIVELLTDVADAIRVKKGTQDKINAQNFGEEIRNLPSGASPFAVDFGEEIASGNAAYINALQEDIDYYNEIQRKRASGEVTDIALMKDKEFLRRIAFVPNGMDIEARDSKWCECSNLYELENKPLPTNAWNSFKPFRHLNKLRLDTSSTQGRLGYFLRGGSVREVDITFDNSTQIVSSFYMYVGEIARLSFPSVNTSCGELFRGVGLLRKLWLSIPLAPQMSNCIRECEELEEVYLECPSVTTFSYCFYNFSTLKKCNIKGLQATLSLSSHPNIEAECIHYTISNAIGGTADAPITLTLHATAKANWEASEYYAEDVVMANEKNITIA